MGLYKAYHEWQKTIEDLDAQLRFLSARIAKLPDEKARVELSSRFNDILKAFTELQISCDNLADLID